MSKQIKDKSSMHRLYEITNSQYSIDKKFANLINKVIEAPYEILLEAIKLNFSKLPEDFKKSYQENTQIYNMNGAHGIIDEEKNIYTRLELRANQLANHWEDLLWMYTMLQDYRSKATLSYVLWSWVNFDLKPITALSCHPFANYFDLDILKPVKNEVFVDLGCFDGTTILDYINSYGAGYKRIYAYEPTPDMYKILQVTFKSVSGIVFRQKAVSDKSGEMYLVEDAVIQTRNAIKETGDIKVEVVTLDEDIQEPITFLKMDIEGSEQSAIRGAAKHIQRTKPKLAITVYHAPEDLWQVARIIDEIQPGYKFYMRRTALYIHAHIPTEVSILAVHPESGA